MIKKLHNKLIKSVETMFRNYKTKDIYEKKVKNGSRWENITRNYIE